MALTYDRVTSWIDRQAGNFRCGYVDITFDDSYPTGGETIDVDEFAPGITLYDFSPVGGGSLTYEFVWDSATEKIIVATRTSDPPAQVGNGTDLSAVEQRFYYRGI